MHDWTDWRSWLMPPRGGETRRAIGWLLVVSGLARLSQYGNAPPSLFGEREALGLLILIAGVAILATWPWRLRLVGRLACVLAVLCLGIVVAALSQSLASIVYAMCLISIFADGMSRQHDC